MASTDEWVREFRAMLRATCGVSRPRKSKHKSWRSKHCKDQGWLCKICSKKMIAPLRGQSHHEDNTATLGHILSLKQGGEDRFENTQAECFSCNQRKGGAAPAA